MISSCGVGGHCRAWACSVKISSSAAIAVSTCSRSKNVGRQEAQHRVAGAVDHDVALQHLRHGTLGELRGVEFRSQHQALAAHIDDGIRASLPSPRSCSWK